MNKKQMIAAGLVLFTAVSLSAQPKVQAFSLGDLIKVGGIGYLVDRYSEEINTFINKLTVKHGVSSEYATKVVPLLTVGKKGYIGAAQVSGPQELVDRTKAALQIEETFLDFRIKALIPIDAITTTNYNRVQGVGVSAQIDVKI